MKISGYQSYQLLVIPFGLLEYILGAYSLIVDKQYLFTRIRINTRWIVGFEICFRQDDECPSLSTSRLNCSLSIGNSIRIGQVNTLAKIDIVEISLVGICVLTGRVDQQRRSGDWNVVPESEDVVVLCGR